VKSQSIKETFLPSTHKKPQEYIKILHIKMTNTSLTDIGFMFMVNVLFISNFFFVRKLRIVVDTTDEPILQRIAQFIRRQRLSQPRQAESNENNKTINRIVKSREIIYAACLGKHRMDPVVGQPFPGWKPIPFKIGVISTAFALLIASVLLSKNAITNHLAISTQVDQRQGFCSTEDFDEKFLAFRDRIRGENVTNFYNAEKQFNVTLRFQNVLNSNTTQDWNNECDRQFDYEQRQSIMNKCTFNEKVCVDAGWGLSIICKTITVTLESCVYALQGAAVEVSDVDPNIESDADINGLNQLNQQSTALVQRLLRQIDIAGSLYTIYVVITLFFPTPIVLFRPSLTIRGKQLLCGVQRYIFIVTVLIIYWGYDNLFRYLAHPEVQIFFKNLVTDPCFIDSDFIHNRTDVVRETCERLIVMENTLGSVGAKINGTLDVMYECNDDFPSCDALSDPHELDRDKYGLDTSFKKCNDIYAPSHFIGNETICVNREYSRNEILIADDTGLNFWQLWIQSGLLAILLIKFAITNFGVALLKMADPFFVCNGEYESPPNVMNANLVEDGDEISPLLHVNETIRDNKIAALKTVAFRDCLVWGLFTNLSLACLVISSSSRLDHFLILDYVVFGIIMVLSIGVIVCYFLLNKKLTSTVRNEISGNRDGNRRFTKIGRP